MEDMILIHWGNKGQKWGTRNYRNYDGTLTEEGKRRYDYYENKTDRSYETGKAKQERTDKKYVKTGKWGVKQEDLSNYTDDELVALTNRAHIEKNYREMFNTKQYSKGKKFVEGFKTAANETADVINAGNNLLSSIVNFAKNILKGNSVKNEMDVKKWLLTIPDGKERDRVMKFLQAYTGKDLSKITPEELEVIKKLKSF